MIYCIWNNKGGVGKTFLSFTLALEHAFRHKTKKVLLVDMCPQANLSEIMLGGDGTGDQKLEKVLHARNRKTIGGYFDARIKSPHTLTGSETSYLLHGIECNNELLDNVYFICGDPTLELQAQVINQISSQTLPIDAWRTIHLWVKDIVDKSINYLGDETTVDVFIDCNPSFSAYTELALAASDNLIIPCSCDGSSARAITNVRTLVYENSTYGGDRGFSAMCRKFDIPLPLVHSIILNRSTQYDNRASSAFRAMFDEIKRVSIQFFTELPSCFCAGDLKFMDIPDYHSVAIVSSHHGKPLFSITPGRYEVHDALPQINKEPLERYKNAICALEELL